MATTLARYIVKTKPQIINLRTIRREAHLQGLSKPEKMQIAANALIEAEWLFETTGAAVVGRKRGDYIVNMKVWDGVEQAER